MRKPLALPLNGAQQCVNTLIRMGNSLRRGNNDQAASSSSGTGSSNNHTISVVGSEEDVVDAMDVVYHPPSSTMDIKMDPRGERRSQTHQANSNCSNEHKNREQFQNALEAIQRTLPSDTNGLWDLLKTLKNMTGKF